MNDMKIFMNSYHHYREQRLTVDEAFAAAAGFVRATLGPARADVVITQARKAKTMLP